VPARATTRPIPRPGLLLALLLSACGTPGIRQEVYRLPGDPAHEFCGGALSIHLEQTRRSVGFLGENDCHAPLFVELSFPTLQNVGTSQPLPLQAVLPPKSQRALLTLQAIDPRRAWSYRWATLVFVGVSPPQPDPAYRYAFPFGGSQPRRLVQGVDGALTHNGIHRFAFDFDMPIGTPVLAARDGTVLRVTDGFGEGRFEPRYRDRSNTVFVLHSDGSIADYGHLSAGIPVAEGARVEAGDLLGLSGNSGYTQGPHLHFSVRTQRPGAEGETVEIRFLGDVLPVEGGLYGPHPGGPAAQTAADRR